MGANSTQAVSVTLILIGFVLLAGWMAGAGIVAAVGALATIGAGAYFSLKCKPWEHQEK